MAHPGLLCRGVPVIASSAATNQGESSRNELESDYIRHTAPALARTEVRGFLRLRNGKAVLPRTTYRCGTVSRYPSETNRLRITAVHAYRISLLQRRAQASLLAGSLVQCHQLRQFTGVASVDIGNGCVRLQRSCALSQRELDHPHLIAAEFVQWNFATPLLASVWKRINQPYSERVL